MASYFLLYKTEYYSSWEERSLKAMKVYDFYGEYNCKSEDELLKALKVRSKNSSNEFELRNDAEYPFMTILIKEDYACVHYFKDEQDVGRYAFSRDSVQIEDEYITFNMGSEDMETEVSNKMVISVEKAYTVAKDFFNTSQMSSDVEWYQL